METSDHEILSQLLKKKNESDDDGTDYDDDDHPKYNIVISIDDPSIFDEYLPDQYD